MFGIISLSITIIILVKEIAFDGGMAGGRLHSQIYTPIKSFTIMQWDNTHNV
jgi:hypothetical protein